MPERKNATEPKDAERLTDDLLGAVPEARQSRRPAWQERKIDRDAQRVRLRLDVPEWLRSDIEQQASDQGMSWSQFGAFLLAYGLQAWHAGDPDLRARFEACKAPIASLRWQYGADLTDFETDS